MIGLDTNVLVRYLTQDHAEQAAAANRLIDEQCTAEDPGLVSLVVLCELVWVLRRAYGCGKETIANLLEQLLTAAELQVPDEEIAWRALRAYQQGPADFPDYCILFANREAGCPLTYSFDRKLAQHPGAAIPEA
jgi:predicted nucleic-acid-binding protein